MSKTRMVLKKGEIVLKKMTEQEIEEQVVKETKISVIMYAMFFLWWIITGYGLSGVDIYIAGLPLWFVLSCCVGIPAFCIATIIVVKKCFKNFDLDQFDRENEDE